MNQTPETFPAGQYLDPTQFQTRWSGDTPAYAAEQYSKAREVGAEYDFWSISATGTWGAGMRNHRKSISSCEALGLHAGTAAFLQGMLDSGKPIHITRWDGPDGHIGYWWIARGQVAGPYRWTLSEDEDANWPITSK